MRLKIQSIHFDADKKLLDFITEKVSKLGHFYEHILDGEVFLKIEKSVHHDNKIVEIKLHVPGKILFAKEQDLTFENATEAAVEAMSKQVKKEKEKVRKL